MPDIVVRGLENHSFLPHYAHEGEDAGLDLFAALGEEHYLQPGEVANVRTGIAVALSPGTFGLVAERSSLGRLGIAVRGGVVDPGYRGEIVVLLHNLSRAPFSVKAGERIAQMIVLPYVGVSPRYTTDALPKSARGEAGFGSTGR